MKTMGTKKTIWGTLCNRLRFIQTLSVLFNGKGQAPVEFTLAFILLLIVAWIPADFGLALYTGQMALNASREGARIGAAERNLVTGTTSCVMPCASETGVLRATADRMSTALMPGATLRFTLGGGATCHRLVTVEISGQYRFFFYQVLRLLGFDVPNSTTISRSTSMRWEHQC